MRRIAASFALATLVVASAPAVRAGDNSPPDARLIAGTRVQARSPYTFCWAFEGGGVCSDGFPRYRGAIPARPGQKAKIRISHPARIDRVDLDGYERVRDTGYSQEAYRGHVDFPLRLRPNRADGQINGWRILFRLPRREGDLYLDLAIDWPQRGDAFYAFHVELRK